MADLPPKVMPKVEVRRDPHRSTVLHVLVAIDTGHLLTRGGRAVVSGSELEHELTYLVEIATLQLKSAVLTALDDGRRKVPGHP